MSKSMRFKSGEQVYSTRDPTLGLGVIKLVDVDEMIIYIGKNEWIHDRVVYATVAFQTCEKNIKLNDLIHAAQVGLYNSLNAGDLIFYGKKKNACRIIVATLKKKHNIRSITTQHVWVLENFRKKLLPIRSIINDVRRNEDCIVLS